jgi:hypothetical protein
LSKVMSNKLLRKGFSVIIAGGGGIAISLQDIIPPGQPIIASLGSPTNLSTVSISGLAEPRSIIDLYDNGELVVRLSALADNNGVFEQRIAFVEGTHILTVRASDFAGNASILSESFILVIDQTAPDAPIILTPSESEDITTQTPELIGLADPFATITILIDGFDSFTVTANGDGAWSFIVPSSAALDAGGHAFIVGAIDEAGNSGPQTVLSLTRGEITLIAPGVIAPVVPGEIVPSIPLPPEAEIIEVVEAIELPGVPVPEVAQTTVEVVDNIIQFGGTALPNKDIVVYIHSDQALVYRTRSDENGLWVINHSQDIVELSPGEHSIFAVTVDATAKVKSRPSEVRLFDVKKNLLATLFNLLNIQTTVITLIAVSLAVMWFYNTKKKTPAPAVV